MENKNSKLIPWLLFGLLSIIWGSSFILMKRGMFTATGTPTLSAFQVAALRMLSAGVVLLPIALIHIRKIPKEKTGWIVLSGLLGSFFPAFLFCIAETKIDSSLAGFLNALTPIFTIVVGILFFKATIQKQKITGVLIAFVGMLILFLSNPDINLQYLWFAGFVLLATILYGFNVNIASSHLKEISSTVIAAIAFGSLVPFSLVVLFYTGFFELPLANSDLLVSTGASTILGVFGTALATILFYILLKRAGAIFASMVTYGIPFVALAWGLATGESIHALQVVGLSIILIGVYKANK